MWDYATGAEPLTKLLKKNLPVLQQKNCLVDRRGC